jgi:hypothetical protein
VKWFSGLRTIALLRRIAKALEAGNELSRERIALEFPEWGRRHQARRVVRKTSITQPTTEEWNENWKHRHGN